MTLDLAKLRAETLALLDGATPGPWVYSDKETPGHFWITPEAGYLPPPLYLNVSGPTSEENARLIAAAPTLAADNLRLLDDNLRLLDEIERLNVALSLAATGVEAAVKRHGDFSFFFGDEAFCASDLDDAIYPARAALAKGGPDDR